MSGQRERFEPGTRHVLAYCRECPPWRRVEPDLTAAYTAAARHAEAVHGDSTAAAEHRRRARDTQ